ncbi:hypothetical protein DFH08DRAFT_1090075 [Mycena albidolilacea]|uniref:Uncharacterized protein n=1 Tax=Mycena albidolilacea TaxID=1033008 RepID=A0AAD7E850_9AGAR|nr:hypothetical protein DFH08DRAFT_1090075 [Mycena albidolilacea]
MEHYARNGAQPLWTACRWELFLSVIFRPSLAVGLLVVVRQPTTHTRSNAGRVARSIEALVCSSLRAPILAGGVLSARRPRLLATLDVDLHNTTTSMRNHRAQSWPTVIVEAAWVGKLVHPVGMSGSVVTALAWLV